MNSTLRQRSANLDSTQPANGENKPPSIAARKRQKLTVLKALSMLVRVVSSLTFIVLSVPFLYLLLPLRPLHPILRKLGIQNNYLPLGNGSYTVNTIYYANLHRPYCVLLGKILPVAAGYKSDYGRCRNYSNRSSISVYVLACQ